ncbi:VOC family protein [Planococcus halotolerans]|uniref:VOC family protein n=1 Tax=Planococcus halotolerans TaxID=2233542 RepID=A0A365KX07_9BACL|nr:VOC family protein [Planococcus halotolerans]QHJ69121.1 VOC family protein [Planococcus halotolerans]RAZ77680.1 VOC family protein [Planococcus halotolerans]
MISKLGQVMVYVDDQDKAVKFWTEKAGFTVIADKGSEDMGIRWIEIAPSEDSATTIVLHDKEVISKMSPELNLGTPSLMFYTDNVDKLYADFKERGVTTGELVNMRMGRTFNFADDEENYFAVMELLEE